MKGIYLTGITVVAAFALPALVAVRAGPSPPR